MTFEKLVATIDQRRFTYTPREDTVLQYQGSGWNGLTPIGKGKSWKNSHCFSPICKSECDMAVRPICRKQKLSASEWDFLIRFLKKINPSIRKMVEEHPPDPTSFAMRFNCGHGYLNYLVFSIWRSVTLSQKSIVFLQYFTEMGYTPQESYVLLQECSLLWCPAVDARDRILQRHTYIVPGVVKRLTNVRRYKVRGAYTMGGDVVNRISKYRFHKKKQYVYIGGFFGARCEWGLREKAFTKETLDSVLKYYKHGRVCS